MPHRDASGAQRRAPLASQRPRRRPAQAAAPSYARHVPERTLLYTLVQVHYPDFIARLEAEDRSLSKHMHEEFEEYLRCGVRAVPC